MTEHIVALGATECLKSLQKGPCITHTRFHPHNAVIIKRRFIQETVKSTFRKQATSGHCDPSGPYTKEDRCHRRIASLRQDLVLIPKGIMDAIVPTYVAQG